MSNQTATRNRFQVVAAGLTSCHADIINASIATHQSGGILYRVAPDGSRREVTPLPADVAKACSSREPREPSQLIQCVSIFRR